MLIPSESNTKVREGSQWPEILATVQDPEFKPAELVRLILSEMALVTRELHSTREHPSVAFRIKPLLAELQALQSMADTARNLPSMIAESDIVNLDGPKFRYVIGRFMEVFQASVREIFGDDLRAANVTHNIIEKMEQIEEDLRRNLDDPQVLMEYEEQARRKREAMRRNQTMHPPQGPTS